MARSISTRSAQTCRTAYRGFRLVAAFVLLSLSAQAQYVRILSLGFEGNRNIDSGRLRNLLRYSREGGSYNADMLARELQYIERYYQDQGFLRAKVGPPSVDLHSDSTGSRVASIRVPVVEGSLYKAGRLAVKNVQAFTPATLMQMCPLTEGQHYSRQKIAEWQSKIEDGYRTLGYIRFQAAVHEDIHELSKVVDCTLECREGNAYSVGKITVVGDESINTLDFKRHLLVSEGGLFNPEMVPLSLQFLNQMRMYRPISDSDVEIRIDDEKSLVDLTFHVSLLRKSF